MKKTLTVLVAIAFASVNGSAFAQGAPAQSSAPLVQSTPDASKAAPKAKSKRAKSKSSKKSKAKAK